MISKLKSSIITGIICLIAGSLITLYLVKKYWPTEIVIEDTQTGQTQYDKPEIIHAKPPNTPENYDYLYNCGISSLLIETRIEDNIIKGVAYDACKHVKFEIKLATKQTYTHTFQAAYMYQLHIGSSIRFSYSYNLGLISIGGGIIIHRENPGVEVSIQKSF